MFVNSDNEMERIHRVIPIIDSVSPTFCLAKWHHANIHLQTGQTHSCYHPAPHNIPLEEIKSNPSALHNTLEKKGEQAQMMKGQKPSGCNYCWNVEALGKDYVSDRKERNSSIFTTERFEGIVNNPMTDVNPEYIEISFGNECNFKCGYCHPKYSSAYHKEIKDYGPYTTVKNHRCDIDWFHIHEEETNPYVEAWWKWWPEVSKTLTTLRITGGEPLLQTSTWKLFEELDKNPLPQLHLKLNSNLGVKPILVQRMSDKINSLIANGKIKSFDLFTSLDTWGTKAEYIRTGLDLEVWEKNFNTYLTKTNLPITLMVTFNILCVTSFKSLLEKILDWRIKYRDEDPTVQRIRFDTPHLKEPLQYDMNILPKNEFMPYMYSTLKYFEDNLDDNSTYKFSQMEFEKFRRVVEYMSQTSYSNSRIVEGRTDFYNWFTEYDKRRGTDFLKTFPEYRSFYLESKTL